MPHKSVTQSDWLHEETGLRCKSLHTDKGQVFITGPVELEELAEWKMADGLRGFRPPERQKEALMTITRIKHGQVFTARHDNTIVGYVTFHAPEAFERWGQSSLECIVELGAIEISPEWRQYGIGKALMDVAFAGGAFDEYIVIATEYYWHWDLKNNGLSVWKYRDLMTGLMGRAGLTPMGTDDPEITSHPANMLMVRIGPKVPGKDVRIFENLRYKRKQML